MRGTNTALETDMPWTSETIRDVAWLASLARAARSEEGTLWMDALEWALEQRIPNQEEWLDAPEPPARGISQN